MWKRGMVSNKRNVRNPMGKFEKTPLREKKMKLGMFDRVSPHRKGTKSLCRT